MEETNLTLQKIMQRTYLISKNIDPKRPYQLDLFDFIRNNDNFRHIPNDYARSSLFTTGNRHFKRRYIDKEILFHYNDHISLRYTGIELRAEDDELIWLQILNYSKSVPMGEPFQFSLHDLVKDIGWHRNSTYYNRVRESVVRLKANEVMVLNSKAYGTSGALSLIDGYEVVNGTDQKPTVYKMWINPNLMILFAGNTFTSHFWPSYRRLSPVARRLADWIGSHKQPYPLLIDTFHKICGSKNQNKRSWRQRVKNACQELQVSGLVEHIELNGDKIYCFKTDCELLPKPRF